ncbi:MAG: hypothetical protein ACREXW_13370 [Gammaproteobacteria bacterium]
MKNITVSVDDETYRRSRIKAAEAGTSVSALVRSFFGHRPPNSNASNGGSGKRSLGSEEKTPISPPPNG